MHGLSILVLASLAALPTASASPVLEVHEPVVLRQLERSGLSLGQRLTGTPAASNRQLRSSPAFEAVVQAVRQDLKRRARSDQHAGVGTSFTHRLFDVKWLEDQRTTFELVGVINRLDRHPFAQERCGETRLVFRLAYTTAEGLHSRLPMTVNLVYWQAGHTCAEVARRWTAPEGEPAEVWLRKASGPLSDQRLDPVLLKSLEINVQSMRWPSTVHPSLGGHAEYILRVFERKGGRWVAARLENTPDVARLRQDRRLRRELLAWVKAPENLARIDEGTHQLPERFLAKRAVSVTPRGLARLANRPFAQLFSARDFDDLSLANRQHTASPEALLRRLDGRTCVGCHQSRSIAGFHLPGEDPSSQKLDALAVGRSPHFVSDQTRRRAYAEGWLAGSAPSPHRGPAEREGGYGGHGARCGLGDPGFGRWTCEAGLTCRRVDESEVGVCVAATTPEVGEPCEPGEMRSKRVGYKDRLRFSAPIACAPGHICEGTSVGFPGGMCAASCGTRDPDVMCGPIALLTPFNRCVRRGEPFTRCLSEHTRPAGLRRCDIEAPCRDDYLCARIEGDVGVCLPPYFLFQMRVDGH